MTTNFRNTQYTLTATTRLSVSFWQEGSGFYASVAIIRKSGKWSIDSQSVVDIRTDCDWLTESRAGFAESELYKQETGDVMPLGFYKNNRVGRKAS